MIAASGKEYYSVAQKVTQTEWDLSSSITGTVKRPSSLESCKSNSPSNDKENIDFPIDSPDDDDITDENAKKSCQINKLGKSSSGNAKGNVKEEGKRKIDSPSIKRRILKLPESARKSFSSKLKLPHSLSNGNKLSLAQLEQKNNLFIRDGQQNSSTKINKSAQVMAKNLNANKRNSAVAMDHSNGKKSLIPSFLSTKTNSHANHIKIPATSKAHSSSNLADKLTKTGNRFKELYQHKEQSHVKKPPPYRPPPPPPPQQSSVSENSARNYEEIDEVNDGSNTTTTTTALVHAENDNQNHQIDSMLAKAEYSSNMFKNIPVRPRKGNVPHMENYCLFDPSVDFCNEKDLRKKAIAGQKLPIEIKNVNGFSVDGSDEKIEDITFEDKTLYDISEHDERALALAHHNYYEIDPELLEHEEEHEHGDEEANNATIVEETAKKIEKSNKIYSNTLSTSSDSATSTSNSSAHSSSTATSSSDYPSLFNSVIETTHSSTIESTDDNDSNGYGKVTAATVGDKINQQNADSNESIITVQNVTCGESSVSNGTKKKSPQLNRIIRQSNNNNISSSSSSSNKQTQSSSKKSMGMKHNNDKVMQQSHSLPHLVTTTQNRCRQQQSSANKAEFNFVIDSTTTIQMRRSTHNSRQMRPLSTHSDDRDSGFLSPVHTPPECQSNVMGKPHELKGGTEQGRSKTESTLLNQCDNIQQMIEVSFYLEKKFTKKII